MTETEKTEIEQPLPPGHCPYCKQKIRGHGWTLSVPFRIADLDSHRFSVPIGEEIFPPLTLVCKRHGLQATEEAYAKIDGDELPDFISAVKQSHNKTELIEFWARALLATTDGKQYQNDDLMLTSTNFFNLEIRFKIDPGKTYELSFVLDEWGQLSYMETLMKGEQECWEMLKAAALQLRKQESEEAATT